MRKPQSIFLLSKTPALTNISSSFTTSHRLLLGKSRGSPWHSVSLTKFKINFDVLKVEDSENRKLVRMSLRDTTISKTVGNFKE